MQKPSPRLLLGFALYGILGALAFFTLSDWRFRVVVLILLAGLALKSWIGEQMRP